MSLKHLYRTYQRSYDTMTDDLIKTTKKVLSGEIKFTDKMLLALYEALESELGDAISCDPIPVVGEDTKLDSETRRLDNLMQALWNKFDITRLRDAEEQERRRIENLGYSLSKNKLAEDLIQINLGLKSNDIITDWHIKYLLDKDTNPVEYVWTTAQLMSTIPVRVLASRFYKIVPYHKVNSKGVVQSSNPKYFCLFESTCIEDSNIKLVAVYESFCQAGYSIITQLQQAYISNTR